MQARERAGRGRAVAAGASLALHAVLLAWLAANVLPRAVIDAPPPPPDVIVELQRAPILRDERPSALTTTTAPSPDRELAPASARPRPLPPSSVRAAPAPPAPLAPLQAPPGPPAPARGPAAAPPAGTGARTEAPAAGASAGERDGDVRGFLRATVGCDHADHFRLTPAERARCDSGFATAKGVPVGLPDDKLAAFSREAQRNEAKRARNEGPLRGGFVPCDPTMVGSNLSPGCLPADAYARIRR